LNSGLLFFKAMQRSGIHWRWPKVDDVSDYAEEDVKRKIQVPKEVKRGVFRVIAMEDHWG
jgi:hypothetical protein